MTKNLLLIFTRNPELGKVKTRLAKTIGNEKALEVYKFLLNKTKEVTKNLAADKAVYYSVKIRKNDIWDASIYQKHQQIGDDLGERMHNAFKEGFNAGYDKVAIVGSDLFDITPKHIEDAFEKLDSNDAVIGPAEDGGYYLLATNKLYPEIFKNKDWGNSTVRASTLADLQKQNVFLLDALNDVDFFEDIKDHKAFQRFL